MIERHGTAVISDASSKTLTVSQTVQNRMGDKLIMNRKLVEEIEENHEISVSRPVFATGTSRIQAQGLPKDQPYP
jgi:hypothetical protein